MLFADADASSTQACIMNQYIKDVSSMLALIFTVGEEKYELHLAQNKNCFLNVLHLIISTTHVTLLFSMSSFQKLNTEMETLGMIT